MTDDFTPNDTPNGAPNEENEAPIADAAKAFEAKPNEAATNDDTKQEAKVEAASEYSAQANDSEATCEQSGSEPQATPKIYKIDVERIKREYKNQQKAERKARRENNKVSKRPIILTALISVVASLLVVVIIFTFLFTYPSVSNSIMARFLSYYASTVTSSAKQSGSEINGKKIQSGDNVTINVDGESSAAAVYAKASRSVVGLQINYISSKKWESETKVGVGQASGVIYSKDGKILTNAHNVASFIDTNTLKIADNYEIVVYFDTNLTQKAVVTEILGYDATNDLALVKVETEYELNPIEIGDSDELNIGDTVFAIGSAGGLEYMNSISQGVLSGKGRNITSSTTGETVYDLLQMTAAISPGSSGGAVLNSEGKLIGISNSKIVTENVDSICFAISSAMIKRVVKSFEANNGKYIRPVVGITVNTSYSPTANIVTGWPFGAYVQAVTAGGEAAKAGIQAEDIITKIDDVEIYDFTDLRRELVKHDIGDFVAVTLYRTGTGETLILSVKLSA